MFSKGRIKEGFQEDTWILEGPGRAKEGQVNYLERLGPWPWEWRGRG